MGKIAVITEVKKHLVVIENNEIVRDDSFFSLKNVEQLNKDNFAAKLDTSVFDIVEAMELNGELNVKDSSDVIINDMIMAINSITPELIIEVFGEEFYEKLKQAQDVMGDEQPEREGTEEDLNKEFYMHHMTSGENGDPEAYIHVHRCGEECSCHHGKGKECEVHNAFEARDNSTLAGQVNTSAGGVNSEKPSKRKYQKKRDIGDYVVLPESSLDYGYMMLRNGHPEVEKLMETKRTVVNLCVNDDKECVAACDLKGYRVNGLTAVFNKHREEIADTPLELKYNKKANTMFIYSRPDITEDSLGGKEEHDGEE